MTFFSTKKVSTMAMNEKQVSEMLDVLVNDTTIPKNIRKALSDAKERLGGKDELNVKVSAAVYLIESISDDINMPPHARTQIWSILGALESIKQG
jgi:uncharacterized protein (UPF0147 family)